MPFILLVDDNPDHVDWLEQCLDLPEFSTAAAYDGRQALELIEQRRPDLVLLDIVMPHLDGLGVLKRLRADDRYKDLPVIVLCQRLNLMI